MREVPVSKIVGSVGRHRDFDRAFLPSKPDLSVRWRRIDEIMDKGEELPPVSLYKIGDAYFVQDGNHRVSVARQRGVEMIDAEVIELRSRVPVDSALTARDLLHKLEHRRLLERLPIDRVLPEIKIRSPTSRTTGSSRPTSRRTASGSPSSGGATSRRRRSWGTGTSTATAR